MMITPVALFVYNRPDHTRETLNALAKNHLASDTELFVFSDGPKNDEGKLKVDAVREIVNNAKGFRKITLDAAPKNKGLKNSIVAGLNKMIDCYEQIIVLEDDLTTTPNFLVYMNKALDFYKNYNNVFTIHAYNPKIKLSANYNYDTYFVPTRNGSWGWGTWRRAFKNIDWELKTVEEFLKDEEAKKKFDFVGGDLVRMMNNQLAGKIDTWDIQLTYHIFKNDAYSVYPKFSKVQNRGTGEVGTHTTFTNYWDVDLINTDQLEFNFATEYDEPSLLKLKKYLDHGNSKLNKLKQLILSYIYLRLGKKK